MSACNSIFYLHAVSREIKSVYIFIKRFIIQYVSNHEDGKFSESKAMQQLMSFL